MVNQRLDVDFGIWGTLRKIAVVFIVMASIGFMALLYIPILKENSAREKDLEIKRQALKKQLSLCQKYSEDLQALKTDPETVKRAARENSGFVMPNETIYRFKDTQ